MLPDELLDAARQFIGAATSITLDADGLPCDPSQALEITITTRLAQRLLHVLRPGDDDAVYTLADAWVSLVATAQGRDRDAGQRWVAARAAAPDLLGSGPLPGVG
jgi:hypothetical protein